MKAIQFITILLLLSSCNQNRSDIQQLQAKTDSLQQQIKKTYQPGLGEFMLGIQSHHAKLWFAGKNANWPLAQYELEEIQESFGDIRSYHIEPDKTQSIDMINTPLDGLSKAIQQKDVKQFEENFTLLTNTCNNCHVTNKHEFNVIAIPTAPPVTNQNFEVKK